MRAARDEHQFYWPDKVETIDRNLDRILVDMLGLAPRDWDD
jgi:hypothetical protein